MDIVWMKIGMASAILFCAFLAAAYLGSTILVLLERLRGQLRENRFAGSFLALLAGFMIVYAGTKPTPEPEPDVPVPAFVEDLDLWPEDGPFSALAANVYDGVVFDATTNNLVGIVQVKTSKQSVKKGSKGNPSTTNITATATVTDLNGKKWSYSKGAVGLDGSVRGLTCTAKNCPVPTFNAVAGRNELLGFCGEDRPIDGARNGMGVKGDEMAGLLDSYYKAKWSVTLTNGFDALRLQLNVQAKGVVKVAGNWESGSKVSASAQLVMGETFALVPFIVKPTAKVDGLAVVLKLKKDGSVACICARTLKTAGEGVKLWLLAGGKTVAELGEPGFIESEMSKGGVAFAARVTIDELSYPAKFAAKGMPSGLKIDSATGVISGKPTKPGSYTVEVTVTSGLNSKIKKTVRIAISIANYTDDLIAIEDVYGPYFVGVSAYERIAAAAGCSVSGLPSGLKWKDDSVSGIPTKAVTNTVYFKKTVKEGGKSVTHQASATFRVEGLRKWAQGTFDGGSTNAPGGMVQLTVSSVGKISGKWMSEGTNWTLSSASFDAYDAANEIYSAKVLAKSGKLSFETEIVLSAYGIGCDLFEAYRNGWKEEPLKTLAKRIKGRTLTETLLNGAPVELKVGADGKVAASGSFPGDKDKRTCSTVLIPLEDGSFGVYLYFPPKANSYDGVVDYLIVEIE